MERKVSTGTLTQTLTATSAYPSGAFLFFSFAALFRPRTGFSSHARKADCLQPAWLAQHRTRRFWVSLDHLKPFARNGSRLLTHPIPMSARIPHGPPSPPFLVLLKPLRNTNESPSLLCLLLLPLFFPFVTIRSMQSMLIRTKERHAGDCDSACGAEQEDTDGKLQGFSSSSGERIWDVGKSY